MIDLVNTGRPMVNPFATSQQKKKITLKKSHALLLEREMKEKGEQIQKKSHKLLTEREMKRNKEKSQRNHKNGGEIKNLKKMHQFLTERDMKKKEKPKEIT